MAFNHEKHREVELAQARVKVAVEICSKLEQPALAIVRKIALDYITECAETFAEFERCNSIDKERELRLHYAFYAWLGTCIEVVKT